MSGVFKLTGAEFKKIFKRPIVFIMALFIVAVVFISSYLFKPIDNSEYTINYEATSSEKYYSNFYSDMPESKKAIDLTYNDTNKIIDYYKSCIDRENSLVDYYNTLLSSIEAIRNDSNFSTKNQKYSELGKTLNNFKSAYADFYKLYNFESLVKFTEENVYYNTDACQPITALLDAYDKHDSIDFIIVYDTNEYADKLRNVLNRGKNFIITTSIGLAEDIKNAFSEYADSVRNNKINRETKRVLLQTSINNYKNYYKMITDSEYPIVLVNKSDKNNIMYLLDNAKDILNIPVADQNKQSAHTKVYDSLSELDIANVFVNYSPSIKQVSISNSFVDELLKIQKTTNTNNENILKNIDNFRTNKDINKIKKEVNNYYLLSKSYNQLINDLTITNITSMYIESVYSEFYNYDLDKYNSYYFSEQITTNKYYIDNNVYPNSFASNLGFNQNSDSQTSALDFVYYSMELCTIIIIIFSMVLICNLITNETESGTIKLLLVRPYKRSKVITSKLLATLFFSVTFLLFSVILSTIAGIYMFGFSNPNILLIFNATTPLVTDAITTSFIHIFTLLLDIIFYILLALMFSVLYRNYAGAITTSVIIFIVMYAVTILFPNSFIITLLPTINLHLFKYFGNAFMMSSGILSSILFFPISNQMNILYSILIQLSYNLVFVSVSYSVFNKRDF